MGEGGICGESGDVGDNFRRQIEAVSTLKTRTTSNCGKYTEEEDMMIGGSNYEIENGVR